MNTLEMYEIELNQSLNTLDESYKRAGFNLNQMDDIEDSRLPKDLKETKRRILEKMESLRRAITMIKTNPHLNSI